MPTAEIKNVLIVGAGGFIGGFIANEIGRAHV